MLHELPIDCLQQIIGYLPSATAVVNIALVNRTLYSKISADNYGVLQAFVQRSFPTIRADLPLRKSAIALTSRSRAWARRAVIARECYPPDAEAVSRSENRVYQKLGYVPAIDSYETALEPSSEHRKEVVALAAGGKIYLRTTSFDSVAWQTLRFPHDNEPSNDILELRLLRPHQHRSNEGETLIFRRANGEISLITAINGTNEYRGKVNFTVGDASGDCMDVSPAGDPILALCSPQTIRLYSTSVSTGVAEPSETFSLETGDNILKKQRCVKFMSADRIAVAPRYLQGRQPAPISICDVNAPRAPDGRLGPTAVLLPNDVSAHRLGVNVLHPLDKICGNDGQLFLSGWSDGVVRLHDTRSGNGSEVSYIDKVDDGQILSLQSIGHESFLAGSHQNACLKTFDMRMPGACNYSYLNARTSPTIRNTSQMSSFSVRSCQRDINIFLAMKLPRREPSWSALPLDDPNTDRYRGSIYSLSAPSSSSTTVYAGIENHVVQLDFIATDDFRRGAVPNHITNLSKGNAAGVLNLSCYERPREGFESTDAVLLRKQAGLSDVLNQPHDGRQGVDAWDERWHLATSGTARGQGQRRQSWGRTSRRHIH